MSFIFKEEDFTFALSCVHRQKMLYKALLGLPLWIKKSNKTLPTFNHHLNQKPPLDNKESGQHQSWSVEKNGLPTL